MKFWYLSDPVSVGLKWLLSPLSLIFGIIVAFRRTLYRSGRLKSYRSPVPVIVVGNLSVGGNGKTPVVIWLTQQLQQHHLTVGVVSRGYGSRADHYPYLVLPQDNARQSGDEPLLIAQRTHAPVCISPDRKAAIQMLLKHYPCDIIISDDGLQHYALQRDREIIVIDGERAMGNGFLLPAGPLRELPARLQDADLIIANTIPHPFAHALMRLTPYNAVNLVDGRSYPLADFSCRHITAIAGIGNPQRFFNMLQTLGFHLEDTFAFNDHETFTPEQFEKFAKNRPLFMTEKDAVKCRHFAQKNWFFIPVEAEIDSLAARHFVDNIITHIKG